MEVSPPPRLLYVYSRLATLAFPSFSLSCQIALRINHPASLVEITNAVSKLVVASAVVRLARNLLVAGSFGFATVEPQLHFQGFILPQTTARL